MKKKIKEEKLNKDKMEIGKNTSKKGNKKQKNNKHEDGKNKENPLFKELLSIKRIFPFLANNQSGCIETSDGYSIILSYSTRDLDLLNSSEQEEFEDSIIQFLMALNFPIKFTTTTTKYDLSSYRNEINNMDKNSSEGLNLEEYRENLSDKLLTLEKSNSTFIRKNYIVIPCAKYPDDPKRTMNELMSRFRSVLSGVSRANIKVRVLKVVECYQFIYDIMHKNSNLQLKDLISNGSFELASEGIGIVCNIYDDDVNENVDNDNLIEEELNNDEWINKNVDKDIFEAERIADSDIFENGTRKLEDCILPDAFKENEDSLYLGTNKYCRMYSIATLPRNFFIGYMDEFFDQLGIIDSSIYIENIPDNQVIRKITSKYSKIASNIAVKQKRGEIIEYDQQAAASDLDALRQLIQTNADRMFYAQIIFKIWAEDEKELKDKSTLFEDICARKGMMGRVLVYDQKDSFINTLPLNRIKFKENLRNITTGAGTSLFPVGNTELSHKEGVYYGTNLITRSPIVFDNFIGQKGSNELSNPAMVIFGKPGSGKSVFQKLKIARSSLLNQFNIVLDPEGEYQQMTEYLGGKYITLKAGEKSGINPFDIEVEENDKGKKEIDLVGKMTEIRQMISSFIKNYRGTPLQGMELSGLEEALKKLYSDRGITKEADSLYENHHLGLGKVKKQLPILSDLKAELEKNVNTKEVAEMMKLITGDSMMAMFDCPSDGSVDISNKLIVFNIKQLDEFSQLFAMTNILTWIWAKYSSWQYKNLFKNVIIDEGWVFIKEERKESVDFINQLVRRGRKYKLSLVIASQNIDEFIRSESGRSVIQLCATKILFKQDSKVAENVSQYFGLSQNCRRYINGFQKGECLMVTESDTVIAKIELFEDFEGFALT